jgi:DNA-binding transcriptional regulator YiaG
MDRKRRRFSPEKKLEILRENLKNKVPISELCQKDVAIFIGVVTDTVTLWEKRRKEPSKRYLKRIEQFLKKK